VRLEVDGQVGGRRRLDRQKTKKSNLNAPTSVPVQNLFLGHTVCVSVDGCLLGCVLFDYLN
jgi:hypothetical protein